MKLNIINIADIHWGVIDPEEQWRSLEFIIQSIIELYTSGIIIDLIVLDGDYFDSKLPLNSREALMSIEWFDRFINICSECKVRKIRMVQGTFNHDNDQLDVFKSYENQIWGNQTDYDFFKIFKKTALENTFDDDIKILYCPDELIQTDEYEEIFTNEILAPKDLAFFHGSFDVVYGELLASKPDLMNKKNVIFHYDLFNKSTYGPLLSGHWHDGKQYDDLYYTGSPFRYKFNEDEPKGISFVQYDSDSHSYFYKKILNPLCADYITYNVYTNLYKTKEDYVKINDDIQDIVNKFKDTPHLKNRLRVVIYIMDDKTENDVFISSLRQNFINYKNIKIKIKNKLKDTQKKEIVKKNKEREKKFGFIYDKSKHPEEIIHDFIYQNTEENANVPLEYIIKKIKSVKK